MVHFNRVLEHLAIEKFYRQNTVCLKVDRLVSGSFQTAKEVKQEWILSLILFNIWPGMHTVAYIV